MLNSLKKLNRSADNKLIYFLFLTSLLFVRELNYLFYNINESPDFKKYSIYLDHFFTNQLTNFEHGILYYYLHAIHLKTFFSNETNFEFAMHRSVLDVNFYLFIIGLLGIYKLLKLLGFSDKSILISLIFINFFPPSINLRMVLKPEVLAFALLPWIVFLFEKFKLTKKNIYLLFSIPIFISLVTLKGNILVILCVYFFITNYKIFYELKLKTIISFSLLSVILFFGITLENNEVNGKNLFELQSGATREIKYDFKAPVKILYNTDLYELFTSPVKHKHAESFLAITLLETNGDYFDLYWDNDATQYFKSRQKIFTFEQSNEIKLPRIDVENQTITIFQQRSTDIYLRETLGLLLSIFFFISLINASIKFKKHRNFLIAIFIGMAVILFHAISGYPSNNFDPEVGDTFKPLYYSFVLLLSTPFLIAIYSEKKRFKFYHLLIYCMLILFTLGFPKENLNKTDSWMLLNSQHSLFCSFEQNTFLESYSEFDCKNKNKTKGINSLYSNKMYHKPFNFLLLITNAALLIYLSLEKKLNSLVSKNNFIKNKK